MGYILFISFQVRLLYILLLGHVYIEIKTITCCRLLLLIFFILSASLRLKLLQVTIEYTGKTILAYH